MSGSLRAKGYEYIKDTHKMIAHYQEDNQTYPKDAMDAVKANLAVTVDEVKAGAAVKNTVDYRWQVKGADGKFVDMPNGDLPHVVGEYQVVASIAAQVNVCAAAEAVVLNMEVKKAVLDVKDIDPKRITPGWTVGQVAAELANTGFNVNGAAAVKEQSAYAKEVKIAVEKAAEPGTALAATEVLLRNEDYRLIFDVTLRDDAKDNFEVGRHEFIIHFAGPVTTKIDVTYTNPGKEIAKVYDGEKIDFDTLVKPEYTAKVLYTVYDSANKKYVDYELQDAEITGVWCNADKVPYAADFVPVDAGVYYYKLSYADATDTYAASVYDDIKVEIRMASIVIKPVMDSDSAKVYVGQKASDILKKVSYNVYKIDAAGTMASSAEVVGPYYWGVAYNQSSVTGSDNSQSYEPVFVIQRAIKQQDGTKFKTVGWENINNADLIEKTHEEAVVKSDGTQEIIVVDNEYRVVFNGKKVVYNSLGGEFTYLHDINDSQKNYKVDWTDVAIEKYGLAVPLTLSDAKEVIIEIKDILGSEVEADFENPIVSTYTGEDLYKTKDLYKKAVVKSGTETVAQNDDSKLTYTWQKAQRVEEVIVEVDGILTTKYVVDDAKWSVQLFNNVEVHSSPYEAGVYRLEIKFTDPTNVYQNATRYVYYTIKPQPIIAVLKGAANEDGTTALPAIYADGKNTAASIVSMIQNTDPENKETYVDLAFYQAIVTEADGKVTATPDEEHPLTWWDTPDYFFAPANKANYFYVETLVKEGKDAGKWVEYTGKLRQDESYRLNIRNLNNKFGSNYNFGKKYNKYNKIEKAEDEKYYENKTLDVTIKNTKGIELELFVDLTDFKGDHKIYDGKPLDITDLKSRVTVRTKKDGIDVTKDVAGLLNYTLTGTNTFNNGYYDNADHDNYNWSNLAVEDAIHADVYNVTISLPTNDTYQAVSATVNGKYEIKKKELVVKPVLVDPIKAGKINNWADLLSGWNNKTHFTIETPVVEGDEGLISTINKADFIVKDTLGNSYGIDSYLRSSKTYYMEKDNFTWNNSATPSSPFFEYSVDHREYRRILYYDLDYVFVHESVAFTPVRTAGYVKRVDDDLKNSTLRTELKDTVEEKDGVFVHTITAKEGVPYFYGNEFNIYDKDGHSVALAKSNYFLFRVYRPDEFNGDSGYYGFKADYANSDYVYANSIESAGGYFADLDKLGATDVADDYITLAFNAAAGGKATFDIMWEKDYVETYIVDLDQMQSYLEADLTKAVSPKSLSFNGATKKMAVGEIQQLDVKMTKNQMSDIICLGYKSDNEDVLKVNDTGLVTAISTLGKKSASATITVFPCYLVNGVKVPITDKGTKTAKVKITVSAVATPKISKVTPYDGYANLTYKQPANGYRRELYVMEGKKKAVDFETAISNVKNGDYSAFTSVLFAVNENPKKGIVETSVGSLTPATTYTVYVRNVSSLRVLEDGTQIATSAAGSVKSFTTKKSQIKGVQIYFDPDLKGQTVKQEYRDGDLMNVAYLKDKSAKVSVKVQLWQYYSKLYYPDINGTNGNDYIWRPLPMDKELKKYYEAPKMNYYVCEDEPVDTSVAADAKWGAGKWVCVDRKYYSKTASIAKVDKNGKVTFKGKGYIYVIVQDSVTTLGAVERLFIDATPTSVTAKKAKLIPGQEIYLKDIVEYKEGKTKIVGYANRHYNNYKKGYEYYVDLGTPEATGEDYRIEKVKTDKNRTPLNDCKITALKAGGKRNMEVTDAVVAANNGKSTVAKFTTAIVQPVKKLKASRIVDDGFIFTFTYPEKEYWFSFELKDARGSVIRNEMMKLTGVLDTSSKKPSYIFTYAYADKDQNTGIGVYNWVDADRRNLNADYWWLNLNLTEQPFRVSEVELTMRSNYNLTVQAVSETGQSSKTTKMKVKTTDVPLSYRDITTLRHPNQTLYEGGETISISTRAKAGYNLTTLGAYPVLKTGNTYTLSMDSIDASAGVYSFNNVDIAGKRMSDSLKWKSSNTKVATVKAKTNTSASLKAVKQGTAVIEATSKITKKVVARYTVVVGAAGDAGSYFGDNEPYRFEDEADLAAIESEALQVTVGNPIESQVKKGEKKWYVFTAPADGEYSISVSRNSTATHYYIYQGSLKSSDSNLTGIELSKNAKWLVCIDNTYGADYNATVNVTGTLYEKVYFGAQNKVKGRTTIEFVAPEDNVYTFKLIDETIENEDEKVVWDDDYSIELNGRKAVTIGGVSTREYTLEITKREMEKDGALVVDQEKAISLKQLDDDQEKKWYSFTADETNSYTFSFTDIAEGTLYAEYYANLSHANRDAVNSDYGSSTVVDAHKETPVRKGKFDFTFASNKELSLQKGQTVYFRLYAAPWDPGKTEKFDNEGKKTQDSHTGTSVTAKLKVTRRKDVTDLTGRTDAVSVSISQNIPKWYSFTADESGYYTISTTGATGRINAKAYRDLDKLSPINETIDGKTVNLSSIARPNGKDLYKEIYLPAKMTIYLKLESPDTTEATAVTTSLLVAKRTPKSVLKVGEAVDVALDMGTVLWYEFDASEYNSYTFYTTGADNADSETDRTKGVISVSVYDNIMNSTTKPGVNSVTGNKDSYNVEVKDVKLNTRDKVYLKLSLANIVATTPATSVKAKLHVKKRGAFTTMPIATDTKVALKKGEEQWYKIVADEKNYYSVALTGTKDSVGNMSVELYQTLDGSAVASKTVAPNTYASFDESDMGWMLQKGDIRYLHVIAAEDAPTTSDKSVEVTVNVRKRKAETQALTTAEAGTVVSLNANEVKWYQFTAEEDNRYSFVIDTITNGNVKAEVYDGLTGSKQDGNASATNIKSEFGPYEVKKGKTYCVKLSAENQTPTDTTKTISATVRVKGRTVDSTALTVGGNGVGITGLKANEEKWFKFLADEKNLYTFYSDNVTGGTVRAEFYEKLTDSSQKDTLATSGELLNATGKEIYIPNTGKYVYLRVVGVTATSALTLKVKKRTLELDADKKPIAISENGVSVSAKKGEEKWYVFTSDMDNCYTFYSDDVTDGSLNISYYSGDVNNNRPYFDHYDGTYGLNQQEYANGSASSGDKNADGKRSIKLYEQNILKKQTVYVRVTGVTPDTGKTDVTMTLKVKRRDASTILETGETGVPVSLDAKSEKWVKFIAPEDNLYTFYSDNVTDGSLKAGCKYSLADVLQDSEKSETENGKIIIAENLPLEKGDVIYIGMMDAEPVTGKTAVTATLKAKRVDPRKLVVGSEDSVELTGNDQWYVFESTESESYVFNVEAVDNKGYVYLYYRTGLDKNGIPVSPYLGDGFKFSTDYMYIKAHKKIYLLAECDDASSTNKVTVKMSVKKRAEADNTIELANGAKKTVTATSRKSSDYTWFEIKATENGYYKIKISEAETEDASAGDRSINVYDKDYNYCGTASESSTEEAEKDANGNTTKWRKYYTLNMYIAKGEVRYLRVNIPSMADVAEGKDSVRTTLDIERPYEVVRTVVQGPEGVEKCAFKAPKADTYYFFTIGSADTKGELWSNGEMLTSNNNGHINSNTGDFDRSSHNNDNQYECWMSYDLYKGQTVEFRVSEGSGSKPARAFTTELHISEYPYQYWLNKEKEIGELGFDGPSVPVTFTGSDAELYSFMIPNTAGAYAIKFDGVQNGSLTAYCYSSYTRYLNNTADKTVSISGSGIVDLSGLGLNKTVYLKLVPNRDNDQNVTANVRFMEIQPVGLNLDGASVPVTMAGKDVRLYRFTIPSTEGVYSFRCEDVKNGNISVRLYANLNDYALDKDIRTERTSNGRCVINLADRPLGSEVYAKLVTDDYYSRTITGNVRFTETAPGGLNITAGYITPVTFTNSDERIYTFTMPSTEGVYSISCEEIANGSVTAYAYASLSNCKNDSWRKKAYTSDGKCKLDLTGLPLDSEVFVKLVPNQDDSQNVTANVSFVEMEAVQLNIDAASVPISLTGYDMSLYSFNVVDPADIYSIRCEGIENGSIRAYAYRNLSACVNDYAFRSADTSDGRCVMDLTDLTIGSTVYVKLVSTSSQNVAANVRVTRLVPTGLAVNASSIPVTFTGNVERIYSFVMPSTGRYNLKCEGIQNGSITAYAYNNEAQFANNNIAKTAYTSGGECSMDLTGLTPGNTVYVKLVPNSYNSQDVTANVSITEMEPVELNVNAASIPVTFTGNAVKVYNFDMPSTSTFDGTYLFNCEGIMNGTITAIVYASESDYKSKANPWRTSNSSNKCSIDLTGLTPGSTVYVELVPLSENSNAVVANVDVVEYKLLETNYMNVASGREYNRTFTASVDGTYHFWTDCYQDVVGYLYDTNGTQLDYNDDYGYSNNCLLERTMSAGETVRVCIKGYGGRSFTGYLNIDVQR